MAEELKESTAPVESAPAPAETDGGLYGAEEIADAFMPPEGAEGAQDDAKGAEAPKAPQEGAEGAETASSAEGAEQPAPAMPEGWDDALWQAATPEIRARVAEQAQAHAAALAKEIQARQQALQAQEQFTIQANAQIQQALSTMQQVVEGEFRQVDWNSLANSDPASYVQLQRMYNDRMGAIRAIQQNVAAQVQQVQQQRAQEEMRQMKAEAEAAEPVVRALVGAGYDGKKFAKELTQYLVSQGVPQEAVGMMSRGYELVMASKAMLFDRMAAQRASAEKKVAEAPKVQEPKGAGAGGDGNDRFKAAMKALKGNNRSTEAIADVFMQMR